ncbi:hypothetical protein ACFFX0_17330 [Citricoccus parietis]|uniref:Uncharacterized protein n=1 Tax=Citricoccus parietis TaxID=592307 RepID=A0ABV5G1Q6_9MICC
MALYQVGSGPGSGFSARRSARRWPRSACAAVLLFWPIWPVLRDFDSGTSIPVHDGSVTSPHRKRSRRSLLQMKYSAQSSGELVEDLGPPVGPPGGSPRCAENLPTRLRCPARPTHDGTSAHDLPDRIHRLGPRRRLRGRILRPDPRGRQL